MPVKTGRLQWRIDGWKALEGNFSFPAGSDGREAACNAGDRGLILESRKSHGEGNGNPLQYSCLENTMDRGA